MGKLWVILLLLLVLPSVQAVGSNYSIVVQENGNSLVIIGLRGDGVINLPIQPDVKDIRVKGGLFIQNNQSIEVSIGSTQEAVVMYKTAMLTTKEGNSWHFSLSAGRSDTVTVAMPKDTLIVQTNPNAMIESGNYTKLIWKNPSAAIEVDYKFQEETLKPSAGTTDSNDTPIHSGWVLVLPFVLIPFAVVAGLALRKARPSKKENIIKTLSNNEALIVKLLLQNRGGIKRNQLERASKLAKSSLANTLNTLERKNIVEIDKTNVTHYIKFTRWFHEL